MGQGVEVAARHKLGWGGVGRGEEARNAELGGYRDVGSARLAMHAACQRMRGGGGALLSSAPAAPLSLSNSTAGVVPWPSIRARHHRPSVPCPSLPPCPRTMSAVLQKNTTAVTPATTMWMMCGLEKHSGRGGGRDGVQDLGESALRAGAPVPGGVGPWMYRSLGREGGERVCLEPAHLRTSGQ